VNVAWGFLYVLASIWIVGMVLSAIGITLGPLS